MQINLLYTWTDPCIPRQKFIQLVIAEGTSVSKGLQEAIELLRNAMVRLYALGVGHKSDYDELQQMAAYPYYVHSFRLRNYAKLRSFSEDLADQVCKSKLFLSVLKYWILCLYIRFLCKHLLL